MNAQLQIPNILLQRLTLFLQQQHFTKKLEYTPVQHIRKNMLGGGTLMVDLLTAPVFDDEIIK